MGCMEYGYLSKPNLRGLALGDVNSTIGYEAMEPKRRARSTEIEGIAGVLPF